MKSCPIRAVAGEEFARKKFTGKAQRVVAREGILRTFDGADGVAFTRASEHASAAHAAFASRRHGGRRRRTKPRRPRRPSNKPRWPPCPAPRSTDSAAVTVGIYSPIFRAWVRHRRPPPPRRSLRIVAANKAKRKSGDVMPPPSARRAADKSPEPTKSEDTMESVAESMRKLQNAMRRISMSPAPAAGRGVVGFQLSEDGWRAAQV